ncbi:hypothetical protein NA57DRAFT_70608 [Rhizodiscina lignyota]|uniref:Altered inheritance of mitochondria protein 11 n=1 Tax=Rhizodiscina lignyota TaxID=1504668 RepID=A0A9P4IU99_9PEZI|nr:hypothetical protein NA57DRAFT_70608 [Rhizodiscina lignyota]
MADRQPPERENVLPLKQSSERDNGAEPVKPTETGVASGSKSARGLILFAGGAGFLLYSSLLTRRSLVRRYKLAQPRFYQSNNAPYPRTNGFPDAVEALGLATISVCSAGMMMMGGWMWALQIQNMEDLRLRLRSKIGGGARPGTKSKQEVEEEIEEWIAKILARKAEKDRRKKEASERGTLSD